mgnify:CR=1 FL=1
MGWQSDCARSWCIGRQLNSQPRRVICSASNSKGSAPRTRNLKSRAASCGLRARGRRTRRVSAVRVSPKLAARRALGAAARRHAPGFLRRRKPDRQDLQGRWGRFGASRPDYGYAAPLPIAVTCHCCGAPQPGAGTGGNRCPSRGRRCELSAGHRAGEPPNHNPKHRKEPICTIWIAPPWKSPTKPTASNSRKLRNTGARAKALQRR